MYCIFYGNPDPLWITFQNKQDAIHSSAGSAQHCITERDLKDTLLCLLLKTRFLLVVHTAPFTLRLACSWGEYLPISYNGHRLQWLSTHAHSGLLSTASQETAWWEQRGGIFMPLSKGLESLEMWRVLLSCHNGNNYQTHEACFWTKVRFIIQLMLGYSPQIPSISTTERLSVPLGPVPMQYLMALPLLEPACSLIWRRILMWARWNARNAERAISEWRLNYPGALIGGSLQSGYPKISWFIALSFLFPCVCACVSVCSRCQTDAVNNPDGQHWV